MVRVSGGALVEDEVRRRAGDPSYRAAAALASKPGVGKSRWEKWRDERGRCARKGAKLTRGPGSAAGVRGACGRRG